MCTAAALILMGWLIAGTMGVAVLVQRYDDWPPLVQFAAAIVFLLIGFFLTIEALRHSLHCY